ncbi:putative reverse transcriptase domain-containing protein [Tanacetum coccineum]
MTIRFNIEKLDWFGVQNHGGSKQVEFKQLGPGVKIGVHVVHVQKRVWFEVELHGAQKNHEAEVIQDSNDDVAVAQRKLEVEKHERKTNMNCLVYEQKKDGVVTNVVPRLRLKHVSKMLSIGIGYGITNKDCVLEILRLKKLYCEFVRSAEFWLQARFFSLVILYLADCIIMEPSKVEAITKWPRPTTLMRKGEKFVWTDERNESFEELKRRLVSAPILTLPSGSGGFQIYSDASKKVSKRWLCIQESGDTICHGEACDIFTDHKVSNNIYSARLNKETREEIKEAQRGTTVYVAINQNVEDGKRTEFSVRMTCCVVLKKSLDCMVLADVYSVPDRDLEVLLSFWKGLQKAWGTRLKFSTTFHPQTDGSWDEYLCLVEFAYNNSWHTSIKAAPFELLYGRKCRAPILPLVMKKISADMSFVEEPESILDRQERVMRNKVIPFVKILWKNHPENEATWEIEESMRASYPHFFV